MTLGEIIRNQRGTRTQVEFAALLAVTKQRIWQWENDVCKPPAKLLQQMGITVKYETEYTG